MSSRVIRWMVVLAAVIAAAAVFVFTPPKIENPTPMQRPAPVPANEPPLSVPQEQTSAPTIRHPIDAATIASESERALPTLDQSDAAVRQDIVKLVSDETLRELLLPGQLVRRIVATVDNLPRSTLARRIIPLQAVPGHFMVLAEPQGTQLDKRNFDRYVPFIRLAASIDTKQAVALYVRFYPLFQQAYRELGYPTGYFNDRLIEAIDDLLAAPEVPAPVRLLQPRVLYVFADPKLESRSSGQRIMIRIGAQNAGKIKAKLREIRRALTGGAM